jgi:hypothetical protein
MKKQIFLALAAAVAAGGCLGSDPNMNSQYYGDAGPPTTGTGTGGSGTATGAIVGTPLATFNTGIESFMLENYHDSGSGTNIDDPLWIAMGHPEPVLTFQAGDGSPDQGSMEIQAPFTAKNQHIDVQSLPFGVTNMKDWSGGKLHVRIKVADGSLATGAGAQVYVKTTATYIYGATYVNFPAGTGWKEFAVDLDAPMYSDSGYDANQVISYGVQLNTGSAAATQGPVTFHIDSFSIAGVAGGNGGSGGGVGGAGGGGGTSGTGDASAGN